MIGHSRPPNCHPALAISRSGIVVDVACRGWDLPEEAALGEVPATGSFPDVKLSCQRPYFCSLCTAGCVRGICRGAYMPLFLRSTLKRHGHVVG